MEKLIYTLGQDLRKLLLSCPEVDDIREFKLTDGSCEVTLVLSGKVTDKAVQEVERYLKHLKSSDIDPKSVVKAATANKIQFISFLGNTVGVWVFLSFISGEEIQDMTDRIESLGEDKKALLEAILTAQIGQGDSKDLLSKLGIKKLPALTEGEEYVFKILSDEVQLQVADASDTPRILWSSSDWNKLQKALPGFNLEDSFDDLLAKVSTLDPVTKTRILQLLSKALKEDDIKISKAKSILGEVDYLDEVSTVVIYPGSFRPPHLQDFSSLRAALAKADKALILISEKSTSPISSTESKKIWDIYKKYLPKPVEVRVGDIDFELTRMFGNPELKDINFILLGSKYKKFEQENVKVKPLHRIVQTASEKLQKTSLEDLIKVIKKGTWVPNITSEDFRKVLEVLLKPLENRVLSETVKSTIGKTLRSTILQEASLGAPSSPSVQISSKHREQLSQLYKDLNSELGSIFDLQFNGINIVIRPRYDTELEYDPSKIYTEEKETQKEEKFDYVPYIASYLQYLKEDEQLQIEPLPDIILNVDDQKQDLIHLKTGHYDPQSKTLVIYSQDRNPKDVLRSFAHEMEHHIQCLEGKLNNISSSQIVEDKDLEGLEAEAYRNGNIRFRKWTEKVQ